MTARLPDRSRVRTVFLGSGGFGRESLRRLDDHDDIELVGVVTAPERPAGRKQEPTATPLHDAADQLGVKTILTPERLRAQASVDAVIALEPELLVLADYGQIVPVPLLELPHGALNLHPSLLPRHRGATPIPAAILAGDADTGVTLMRMDAGLDTGPIVARERLVLDGTEIAPVLEETLAAMAAELLDKNVGPWIRGETKARPQDASRATLTRPLTREDGRLDPMKSTSQLERQVRAFQPWPGSFVDTVVGRLVIWRAEDVDLSTDGEDRTPGRIGQFGMYARDGTYIAFREVQPAGGKRMPWEAFVRGRPSIVGSSVVPGP